MKKRILTALLTIVLLFAVYPASAYADLASGDTLEGALAELDVTFRGGALDWLTMKGTVRNQTYTYFNFYNTRTHQLEEHPVYCIDPALGGAKQAISQYSTSSVTYIKDSAVGDAMYLAVLNSGYPHQSLSSLSSAIAENSGRSDLGNLTVEEAYYGTKMALWAYILGCGTSDIGINSAYGPANASALRVYHLTTWLYQYAALAAPGIEAPAIHMTPDSSTLYPDPTGEYLMHTVTIGSTSWIGDTPGVLGEFGLSWANPSIVPPGTKILTAGGADITSTMRVSAESGGGMGGNRYHAEIRILYPKDAFSGEQATPTLRAKALVAGQNIFVAHAELEPNRWQRYLVESDPKQELSALLSAYAVPDITYEMGLRIMKVESGTDIPLSGAIFEVLGPDGALMHSGPTDMNGIIDIPTGRSGKYTVTEKTPPQGHLPAKVQTQTVFVQVGEVAQVTFANDPYGSLRVEKRDGYNGANLAGAVIQIRNIVNGAVQSQTTDASGSANFTNLIPGAYEIRELSAPAGYQADTQVNTVNVLPLGEGLTTYTFTNAAKPGLRIIKIDRQSMERLEGVTFEVYKGGALFGTYSTDYSGEILLTDLEPDTYIAKEIATANGYVLDQTAQWVTLTAGQGYISQLIYFNDPSPGIWIVKLDSENLQPLPNAVFRVRSVGGSYIKEFTTDADGRIDLTSEENLEPGSYIIEEIGVPDGYLPDNAARTVRINAGEDARFVFTNTRMPSLEILKYDAYSGRYLPGAAFRIAKIENGTNYLDRVTDGNGRIALDGKTEKLSPGVYSVKETAAPGGYVLNTTEYHVELFPGKTSTLVVNNEKKPDLEIVKTDAVTGLPIGGTIFKVRKTESATITTLTTDAKGEAWLYLLDPGIYEVWEEWVPDSHLIDTRPQYITLTPNRTGVLRFQNYPKPSLTINKIDSVTKDPIKGARFHVRYASNNTFTGELRDLGEYYTGENGTIVLIGLNDGWYRATEVEAAAGYSIKEPVAQDIYIKAGTSQSLTFENVPKSAVIVRKVDASTGEPIPETLIRIRYLSGTSGTGGTVIFEGRTSLNGTVAVTNLKSGTYVCEEVSPAADYVMSGETSKTVYITENEQSIVTVELTNRKKGQLVIRKLDSSDGKPLADAVFLITDSAGAVIGPNNGEYVTGTDGMIMLSEPIAPGTTIIARETRSPAGYVLDQTPQSIKIVAGETHTLTFHNAPNGGVRIVKRDAENNNPIEGVEYEIRRMNGERIGTYKTDRDGIIYLPLDAGWYTASERKAAKSYTLDASPHDFEVEDGKVVMLELTNRKESSVLIHKIDSVSGKGIYGVSFLISDENHNPVMTATSDQDGYVYTKGLSDGKYYIREIEAEGYVLDTEVKTVYVKYGSTTEIEWKNTPVMGQIQIIKYSFDDNPVTGLPAGSLLKGAVFEISKAKSGTVVCYITSDARGVAASEAMPIGRYFIKEVTAPSFYRISDDRLEAEIEYPGQIIRLSAYDKSARLETAIKKTGNLEIVAGDSMRYDFPVIANASNVPLSDFYWSDRIPTDAVRAQSISTGTYSQRVYYRALYKTNYGDYRVLAANLLSTNNYSFNLTAPVLGLMAGEAVTEIRLEFGTVEAGFTSATKPVLTVLTLPSLPSGYQIINRCEVGGRYQGAQQTSTAAWITKAVRFGGIPPLPKTGY